MDDFKPLKVEHIFLWSVNLDTIKRKADDLYMRRLDKVRYVILSVEDYTAISIEIARHMDPFPDDGRDYHLRQVFGMHVTYDYELKRGEVILLYPG